MTSSANIRRKQAIVSCAALSLGLLITATMLGDLGRASGTPTPGSSPEQDSGIEYDAMISDTDEGRAEFGSIFLGTVITVAGKESAPTSDPEDSIPIILYDVEVEQSLKGDISGVVRVWFEGFDADDAKGQDAGPLSVGNRLMFFGGYNPEKDWYPVNAGVGVIPVKNDRHAQELIATFTPLIKKAERNQQQPPPPDPCEQPREAVSIALEAERVASGDNVRLTGGPFPRPEVAIWWDGDADLLGAAEVRDDCTIDTVVAIPKAQPGAHRIVVRDALNRSVTVAFEIVQK